jgi:hypothetical protein
MRALAELVLVLLALALVAGVAVAIARTLRGGVARWRVDTRTRQDGTLVVALRRGTTDERVLRELPPGMDPVDLATELQLAREEGELALRELNRDR